MSLGGRMRTVRLRQGRTLQQVAEACGFTRSLLSKIENGRTSPPVATLMRIAAALSVKASALLDGDPATGAVVERASAAARREMVRTESGYRYFPFAAGRVDKLMQPFLFVARRGEMRRHRLSHAGEEFIHVLSGRMRYRVGEAEYELGKGDALYFDAAQPHALEPLTAEVVYLGVFAEPPAGSPGGGVPRHVARRVPRADVPKAPREPRRKESRG
jgi:transcriptional regulator with XRE-family HTH domain